MDANDYVKYPEVGQPRRPADSGATMTAALQAARSLTADQVCLVLLPAYTRNYLSTFVNNEWMEKHGLL